MKAPDVKNEPYEAKKLEAVYNNLLVNHQNSQPRDYEIRADDFTVIERNNDPSRFMSYSDYITPETKYISVFLYRNNNQSDKFFFHLKPNQYTQASSLSGINYMGSPAEYEQQQKEKWRKEFHYEELMRENEKLKRELEKYESAIESIEEEKELIRSNRDLSFEQKAGLILSGLANSEFVQKKFPFLSELSGTPQTEATTQQEHHASFKRKGADEEEVEAEEAEAETISDEERGYIQFVQDIKTRVGEVELSNVMHLLDLITANPQAIHFALKQVSNYLKQKPNPNEKV